MRFLLAAPVVLGHSLVAAMSLGTTAYACEELARWDMSRVAAADTVVKGRLVEYRFLPGPDPEKTHARFTLDIEEALEGKPKTRQEYLIIPKDPLARDRLSETWRYSDRVLVAATTYDEKTQLVIQDECRTPFIVSLGLNEAQKERADARIEMGERISSAFMPGHVKEEVMDVAEGNARTYRDATLAKNRRFARHIVKRLENLRVTRERAALVCAEGLARWDMSRVAAADTVVKGRLVEYRFLPGPDPEKTRARFTLDIEEALEGTPNERQEYLIIPKDPLARDRLSAKWRYSDLVLVAATTYDDETQLVIQDKCRTPFIFSLELNEAQKEGVDARIEMGERIRSAFMPGRVKEEVRNVVEENARAYRDEKLAKSRRFLRMIERRLENLRIARERGLISR